MRSRSPSPWSRRPRPLKRLTKSSGHQALTASLSVLPISPLRFIAARWWIRTAQMSMPHSPKLSRAPRRMGSSPPHFVLTANARGSWRVAVLASAPFQQTLCCCALRRAQNWRRRGRRRALAETFHDETDLCNRAPFVPGASADLQPEAFGDEQAAVAQAAGVDAVADANRQMPLVGNIGLGEFFRRDEQGFQRNDGILIAMHEQYRRAGPAGVARGGFAEMFGADQYAGIADDRGRRALAAQAHMQRHHRALAEADQREARFVEAEAREFRIEKDVERRPRLDDAGPTLIGALALVRAAIAEREPLPTHRRHGARLGRIRRHEGGVRQPGAPLATDFDQILAVRAIAMQKYDELFGLAALGVEARTIDRLSHAALRKYFQKGSILNRLRAPSRRAVAPRGNKPIACAPRSRAAAASARRSPPAVAHRAVPSTPARVSRPPARRYRRRERHRDALGRTAGKHPPSMGRFP